MKINVIIVDDHSMFLDGMSVVLSNQENINVQGVFNNAKEALEALEINTPDLLITDISMPEINGLELIKIVNKQYPGLKILVVSMFKQVQAFEGVNGYLLKETSSDEFLLAINKIVVQDETYFYKDYETGRKVLDFQNAILTQREKSIVYLIAEELTTGQIAEKLFLSRYTVETHKKNIYMKLQVKNAAGLVKKAVYLGYIN